MPELPPRIKANVRKTAGFIRDGVQYNLGICELCGKEVYLAEKHSVCDGCKSKKKKKR